MKNHMTTLVKAADALRTFDATPRYIYCNQAFHDELLAELRGCLRATAYQPDDGRVDSFNGLELVLVPGDGEPSFIVTCDRLPV